MNIKCIDQNNIVFKKKYIYIYNYLQFINFVLIKFLIIINLFNVLIYLKYTCETGTVFE